nr:MAG TPA: ParB ddrB-like ParB superfamily domain [Caudoviricetes sp.]
MIFLREYSEELPTAPVTSPVPQVTVEPVEQEPSWYTGMGDAIWQGACAAYLENQSALKGVVSSAGFGDDEYRAWLDATAAENRRLVRDEYTPDPEKTSVAAQVLYGVSNGLAKYGMAAAVGAAAGPASIAVTPVVFGASVGINETQKLKDEGVDDETATKAGMVSGAMNAFWGGVPGAFGRSIKAKVLTGASLGAFTSYNEMGAIKTVLENADYSKLALKYDPTDPVGMGVNALVGGLMGPVSAGASWKTRGSKTAKPAEADAPELTDVDVEDAARYRATQIAAEANLPVDHGNAEQVREAHQAEATAREQIDAGKPVRMSEKAVAPEVIQEIREKSLAKLAAQSKRDGAILQNRDRSSKESVAQMREIAAHPDYLRVSISNSLSDGAPVVTDWADIPNIQRGTAVTLVDGTGVRYDSHYVVVDADTVITSNDINGQPNNLYGVEGVDAAYAVAGNGRVTALNHAYDLGTADTYKKELMLDAARHGVDPDVIAEMQKPILVRVVDKEKLPVDIADRTNTRTTAEMSMVEQAINDAQRIDLASLKFTEDGNVSLDTISQFVQLMPASERNRLVVNGVPTAEANARLDAAIFQSVYKTPGLTGLLDAGKAPAGVSTMLRAYRALAPKLLDLDGTGDLDVRTAMAEVLNEFVSTRANGQKLSVSELAAQKTTTRSPMAQAYLDYFAKVNKEGGGYKRIVDDISSSAVLIRKNRAMAEADAASGGTSMFGDVTTLSQLDVMRDFSHRTGVEIDEGQFIKTDSLAGAVQFEAERRGQALRDAIDYAMRKEGMAPISAPKPFKLVEVGRDGDKVHRVFGLDGKPDLMVMPEGVDGVLPLPVRLQEGTLNGDHIRKHEKELQQAGYSNVEHALYDVVRNWAWVSKGTKADSLRIVRPIVVDEKGRLTRAVIQVEFQKVAGVYRVGSVFYSKQPIEKETLLFDRQTHDRGLLSLHEGQPQDWHPPATSVGNNKVSGTAVPNESIGQDLGDVKTFKSAAEQEKHVSDAAVIRESIEHVRTSAEDADLKALTDQALIVLEDSPDMVIPLVDANGDPASISAAELIAREDARAAELEKTAKEGVTTAVACALINNGI